jgi:hypothetical protein
MLTFDCSLFNLNRTFIHTLVASVLAATAILCGIVPEFSSQSPRLNFSSSAYTQDFNDQQIANYARAVLLMESYRQQAYKDIQRAIGQPPPEIVCNQPSTFRNLPSEAQKIAVNYCKVSKKIVENSGISVSQFNTMTTRIRSDQNLERRIQNAMIRLQQQH